MAASMTNPPTKGSLLAVFLTVFIDLLGFGIVLPLLPIYARQFTLDETGVTIGLLASSFSLMQFLFAPVWGRLSDRIGRRPVLMIGLTGSTLSYAVFGIATNLGSLAWMFVSRIGAGIAGATIPTAQAYIADTTTRERRAKGMALIGAAFGLGFTFGPLLAAGALIGSGDAGVSPWPGFVASGLSACALAFAYFKLPESLQPGAAAAERRLLDVAALRAALAVPTIGAILLSSFVAVLSFANFEGILSFLLATPRERGGFGYRIVDVVLYFAVLGLLHAAAQGLVRRLSSRTTESNLATTGAAGSIVGYLILVWAARQHSLAWLLGGIFVLSTGFAFMTPALLSLISRRSDPAQQGSILGVAQSLSALGRILGHGLCFPLFEFQATLPFWLGAALMTMALVLIGTSIRGGRDFGDGAAPRSSDFDPAGRDLPANAGGKRPD